MNEVDTDKLIILNGVERPCMHLVCRETEDKIYYINKKLRKRYPKLRKSEGWANLTDYGFIYEDGKYILKNESKVKYYDGKVRKWQGKTEFTYNEILNSDIYGE
jgi:hypothetical protein